ncbi:MAG: hypothetical protein AB7T63_16970 [Planctomycetota bacterium]
MRRLAFVLPLILAPCMAHAEEPAAELAPHELALQRAREVLLACAEHRALDPAAKARPHYSPEDVAFAWLALRATGWTPTKRARSVAEYALPTEKDPNGGITRYVAARVLLAHIAPETPAPSGWLEQLGRLRISRVAWRVFQDANWMSLGSTLWACLALHARSGDSAMARELRDWQLERFAATQLRTGAWSKESLADPPPRALHSKREDESLIVSLYAAAQVGLAQSADDAPTVRTVPRRRVAAFARSRFRRRAPWSLGGVQPIERRGLEDALAYVVLMRTQGCDDRLWFDDLAARLVATQKPDGSWGESSAVDPPGLPDVISTAIGVLILARPSGIVLPASSK